MNMKPNWPVHQAVDLAVYDAVDRDAYGAVPQAVYDAVYDAVSEAVWQAVGDAVRRTSHHDPPHPSLDDFMTAASAEAP